MQLLVANERRKYATNYIITFVCRQTDWPYVVCNGHAIVESQQGHVVIKIAVAELLRNGAQHESRLGANTIVASIVFTECHLNHEPHETLNAMSGCKEDIK